MSSSPTVEVDLARRCDAAYIEGLWQYVRYLPGAERRDFREGTMVRCGLPASVANFAFFLEPPSPASPLFEEARAFLAPSSAWRILLARGGVEELGARATRAGLRPSRPEPGMVLRPLGAAPAAPPSLTVRRVDSAPSFQDFGTVWSEVFRIPGWLLPLALPRPPGDEAARGVFNRLFVGYADGEPVACSTLTVTGGIAWVASVGVLGRARRRGFGAALTWAAVSAGKELGAETAYLAATPMGYPVYERMGFRRAADYPSWERSLGLFGFLRRLPGLRRSARNAARPPVGGPAVP